MNIQICTMNSNDIENIEPNFQDNFDKFWSVDTLKDDFGNENSTYIVSKINNEIVGFAGIKIVLDVADIMNIVVKIDKRRLGIGSLLLENLIILAKKHKCTFINLEVNENNLTAISLYEKYNFKRIGLRKKYYNNKDTAVIMQKKLIDI